MLYTDDFYISGFGAITENFEEAAVMSKVEQKYEWINYLIAPVFLFIVVAFTTFCLTVGTLIKGVKILIRELWGVSIKSHIVFSLSYLVVVLLKIFLIHPDFNHAESTSFQSILVFFPEGFFPEYVKIPLEFFNITQLAYIFVLSYFLGFLIFQSYGKNLALVILSYGTGLLFWTVSLLLFGLTIM